MNHKNLTLYLIIFILFLSIGTGWFISTQIGNKNHVASDTNTSDIEVQFPSTSTATQLLWQDIPTTITPTETKTVSPAKEKTPTKPIFDAQLAYQHVLTQLSFGPRTPGSSGHEQFIHWAVEEFDRQGWDVALQETTAMGHPIRNIVAKRGSALPWVILGAHYDSRMVADNDPDPFLRNQPVPGANDGASGVAILMELSRIISCDLPGQIWIVLFDAEDQGNLEGWDWILGSRAFVETLESSPDAVIILDMVADNDLNLYYEANSDPKLSKQLWETAAVIGYGDYFIPEVRHSILDDHIPFLQKDIPAVDIIDFDYPYWHTSQDNIEKISSKSLEAVGETVYTWLVLFQSDQLPGNP